MIERLAKEGPVTVHLQMDAHMEADVQAGNVMGEIVGSEHPEQVVSIGGHIDSWDVGQGAQDDGAGIMGTFQAVTLLHKLGLKPKRTIRLVFWVNEENGGAGGRAYREWIGNKIGDQVAAIEMEPVKELANAGRGESSEQEDECYGGEGSQDEVNNDAALSLHLLVPAPVDVGELLLSLYAVVEDSVNLRQSMRHGHTGDSGPGVGCLPRCCGG